LCLGDRLQQLVRVAHVLCQPGPAEIEAGVGERLVLTVKQCSPLELIDHHCGDKVEMGAAAIDPSSIGGGQGRF
jgi:hypothetical protein